MLMVYYSIIYIDPEFAKRAIQIIHDTLRGAGGFETMSPNDTRGRRGSKIHQKSVTYFFGDKASVDIAK